MKGCSFRSRVRCGPEKFILFFCCYNPVNWRELIVLFAICALDMTADARALATDPVSNKVDVPRRLNRSSEST